MRIEADKTKCQGYASCIIESPDDFDLGDDNKVWIIDNHNRDKSTVLNAVAACPAKALKVVDDDD